MVLPGHLAGGYLATQAILTLTGHGAIGDALIFSNAQISTLLIIGTLAGDLPDIDLIRFSRAEKSHTLSVRSHREYFTHGPLFWLIVCLIIVSAGILAGSFFTQYLGLVILAGTWSHFILDTIEDGVMWLWPFSKKRFGLIKSLEVLVNGPHSISYYWNFIINEYPKHVSFYLEIILTVVAIWIVFLK